jgi:hypothetical protein
MPLINSYARSACTTRSSNHISRSSHTPYRRRLSLDNRNLHHQSNPYLRYLPPKVDQIPHRSVAN